MDALDFLFPELRSLPAADVAVGGTGAIVTRAEAKALRLTRYFTGKRCKHGHLSERLTCNASCVACLIERSHSKESRAKKNEAQRRRRNANIDKARKINRFFYGKHREKRRSKARARYALTADERKAYGARYRAVKPNEVREATKRWRGKNPEAVREYGQKYRAAHKDKLNERNREWRAAHPGKVRQYCANRRARKRGIPGSFTAEDVEQIRKLQKNRCAEPACRASFSKVRATIDHIIPVSRPGSSNWPKNIQLLCPTCNARKHNHDPIEHARFNGRLL